MNKNTFEIGTDAAGKQFVYQKTSELDKNHGIHDNGFDRESHLQNRWTNVCAQ